MPPKTAPKKNVGKKNSRTKKSSPKRKSRTGDKEISGTESGVLIPRTITGYDEDDVLVSGGGRAAGFGRCGGRIMSSQLEQKICDLLSRAGVTHCHTPRHFEVRVGDNRVAAYAPMVVLRGRGREGKTVVIEAMATADKTLLEKIQAFRKQYGSEFYVTFIAPEETLDEISVLAYDESCATTDLNTLIGRLAE